MTRLLTFVWLALLLAGTSSAQPTSTTGILLLAHGGRAQWNQHVTDLAAAVGRERPVEVAFGMATRSAIQGAVDRLIQRGVTDIVAVPLFVSSWSSVITSTEYLLGLRAEAPRELAAFAKMDHSAHGSGAGHDARNAADHSQHPTPPVTAPATPDPASPIISAVPIRMTAALNRHELVGRILADRARSISTMPATEAVILVAHGPVPDEDNRRWLEDMAVLAEHIRAAAPFGAVHFLTVRDDAGPAMREQATKELRGLVERETTAGRRVLIVPHLLSFGGIEQGIHKRLEGLSYTMTSQALMPDDRLREWVLQQASPPSGTVP